MRRLKLAALAACIPLAGCGSLFHGGDKLAVRAVDGGTVSSQAGGAIALEEARAAMRGGNVMAAMTAFRIAQRDPATAAEATNGLGVAWATLGRDDLAEKLFIQAIALEPQDRRFAANLERLYTTKAQALALAEAGRVAAQRAILPQPVAAPAPQAVHVNHPSDRLVRVSRQEVHIGGGADSAAPAPAVTTTGRSRVSSAVTVGGGSASAYPIRVAIPRRGDRLYGTNASAAAQSYPVRVAIAPAGDSAATYPARVRLPQPVVAAR